MDGNISCTCVALMHRNVSVLGLSAAKSVLHKLLRRVLNLTVNDKAAGDKIGRVKSGVKVERAGKVVR